MERKESELQQCPECKQQTLHYDPSYKLYECQNDQCKRLFNQRDLDRKRGISVEAKPIPVTNEEQTSAYQQRIDLDPTPSLIDIIKKPLLIAITSIIAISAVAAVVLVYVVLPALNLPLKTPVSLTVKAGNMRNTLTWVNDKSADGVVIVYDSSNYPVSIDDGTLLYSGSGSGYIHDDLEYNDKIYYSIWSFRSVNDERQYSEAFKSASATPFWSGVGGEAINEYVEYDNYRVAGADGGLIELTNNPDATSATWSELKQFLLEDETDKVIYEDDVFVCADFAEMLHNNAEEEGIRAAYVVIYFVDEEIGHTCNAFNTTDRGLVFIDCTGTETGDVDADTEVEISIGAQYTPTAISPATGTTWLSMGEVEEFWVIW